MALLQVGGLEAAAKAASTTAPASGNPIESAWHHQLVTNTAERLPKVLIVLLLLFLVQRIIRFFVHRLRKLAAKPNRSLSSITARNAQIRTMAAILRATSYSILGFLAFLQILNLFGIDYEPLLASAGIVGVGIGLAAQSLFKDIINGVFILFEDQYNVGEVVKVATLTGTVEDLTLRLTRLRDFDGTLYIIPNSQIATVSNLSRDYALAVLNVTVDASAAPDLVIGTLEKIAREVAAESRFAAVLTDTPVVLGVDKLEGRAVTYPVTMRVQPLQKDGVLREMRRRIVTEFESRGIPLGIDPNMLVHSAVATHPDPTATPAQEPLVAP